MVPFTKVELRELNANPTFQKLKAFLVSESLAQDPSLDTEFIAKKALVETGQMEVFRTVDALITEIQMNETKADMQELGAPFEHYGDPEFTED